MQRQLDSERTLHSRYWEHSRFASCIFLRFLRGLLSFEFRVQAGIPFWMQSQCRCQPGNSVKLRQPDHQVPALFKDIEAHLPRSKPGAYENLACVLVGAPISQAWQQHVIK